MGDPGLLDILPRVVSHGLKFSGEAEPGLVLSILPYPESTGEEGRIPVGSGDAKDRGLRLDADCC
jgi:hypothetical protein